MSTLIPSFDIRDGLVPDALSARLNGEDGAAWDPTLVARVRDILNEVRAHGDEALIALTERFDGVRLTRQTLRAPAAQLEASARACSPELRRGLEAMIANVRAFHAPQRPTGYQVEGAHGSELRFDHRPVRVAALYVPGGTAAYPTTVVMNAVPAQIAGVERIIVLTPPATLEANPAIGATLALLGLDEVYQIGGAQAIAAAAFGTATVPRADVIVGPGNIYVALAKREVYGTVGIDAVAGPSEVLVIADDSAPAHLLAADLIAQAEHDRLARCILLTTSASLIGAVEDELGCQLAAAGRRDIAEEALRDHGALVLCRDLAQMVALSNRFAPEHLQVLVRDDCPLRPEQLVAGAIFWGPHTPTAFGDYWAGPNHVLPTSGTARFTGPLSVCTFMRTASFLRYTAEDAADAAPRAAAIADAEQLPGHAAALRHRATSPTTHDAPVAAPRRSAATNVIPRVRALSAYTLERRDTRIKLNQNESPWDLPEALKQQVLARVAAMPWNRYPDFHPADVLETIGHRHDLPAEAVLIGNGSNELLQAIFAACTGHGVPVALPSPTFSLYKTIALANEASVEIVPLQPDLSWDRARLEALAAERRAHLLICNPNNPTGSAVEASFIDRLCHLTDRLVIVDEAYIQFADEGTAADHLIARHPHLIILRTLSKAAGLAGIRFGYAIGSPEVMREVSKVKLPYNIGHFGLEVVRCVLADETHLPARVASIKAERERLREALTRLGVHVWPSQTNFLLFRVPDTHAVFDHLAANDLLIRDVSHYPMLRGCLRVTIGTPEENSAFLRHLGEVYPVSTEVQP